MKNAAAAAENFKRCPYFILLRNADMIVMLIPQIMDTVLSRRKRDREHKILDSESDTIIDMLD